MRPPLSDATNRLNYCQPPGSEQEERYEAEQNRLPTPEPMSIVTSPQSTKGNADVACFSPVIDSQVESNRNSALSAASIVSSKGKRKTHVGPWQLGRTLGRGSTGRVRLAKHALTGQTAAIKIVSKKSAAIAQSESIAAMDRNIGLFSNTGTRPMPSGIEREVVIMKLIEHQNVISLYDVWENRGELYLVLEYVEGGELFDYVSNNGPLPEEEAVRLFRQIIAGLGYCHRFNICHRDLKPENILLDGWHNVKLADFGMAALQPEGHWLNTSCGSPHYAAPEIIYGRKYRGDKADIWSCGIILYALLTGYLPFDGGDLANTLRLVKKGEYYMPRELSDEAADLIDRILQKRPEDRITMLEMWSHPLLKKYEKLHQAMANHYIGPPPPLSAQDCGPLVTNRHDIDLDLLRNLQTLWHDVKPDALIERLLKPEPTYERMFYNALVKFRNEQLENYQGQPLEYSASDYHHISKGPRRRASNRNSHRPRVAKRRGGLSSVKDNEHDQKSVKEVKVSSTEVCDPFGSHQDEAVEKESQLVHAAIINKKLNAEAHVKTQAPPEPYVQVDEFEDDEPPSSPFAIIRNKKSKMTSIKSFQTRTSHSSLRRTMNAPPTPKSFSYKRNVCFQHVRNRSHSSLSSKQKMAYASMSSVKKRPSQSSLDVDCNGNPFADRESSPMLPAQPTVVRGAGVTIKSCSQPRKVRDSDIIWKDDARKVSHELSQICEQAFNGGSASTNCTASTSTASTPATSVSIASPESSPRKAASGTPKRQATSPSPTSPTSYGASLTETRQKLIQHSTQDGSDEIPPYLITVITHLDRLIEQDKLRQRDRRDRSSGGSFIRRGSDAKPLPIISEEHNQSTDSGKQANDTHTGSRDSSHSTTDAPPNSISRYRKRTVRMVPHSSLQSMGDATPLEVYKKHKEATANRAQRTHGGYKLMPSDEKGPTNVDIPNLRLSRRQPCELDPIAEVPVTPKRTSTRATETKKWPWFRNRTQTPTESPNKSPVDQKPAQPVATTVAVDEVHPLAEDCMSMPHETVKNNKEDTEKPKMGFFRKFMKKKANKSSPEPLTETETAEPESILIRQKPAERPVDQHKPLPARPRADGKSQNWFARVFHFKPATRVVALNASKMKARKEVYKILRKWKQYGLEEVYLDKANSIIHGKVGEVNFLRLRPVEFSAEFYTVLEHGRQANISLVRFRQERGAASSFHKVVDTLYNVMRQRALIVEDPSRARKMTRILDAFPDP
ncbi:putative serine/threonine protein kinase [Aspergillus terreus]|uniref:non-specific serine/threonine protein kinase n=1 Tax=Aspergillus terreus TaxID=33178 RepID=A0A5M3Z3K1_ASPTE|nr:hypothetical protein ATETN484_0008044300 [Aspergillus terreus]GFF21271.1 putative serine/threonine protein kinase [Aspergillus terreus]